jgi:hypothetical protein
METASKLITGEIVTSSENSLPNSPLAVNE